MIEDVEEIGMQVNGVPLRDLEVLHHRKVEAAEGRSIQCALLQRALSAGLRVEERLSSERCGAIRRNPACIRTDIRRIEPIRSIAGHERSRNFVQLRNREVGIDGIVTGASTSVNRAASRQYGDRTARLDYADAAEGPSVEGLL